MQNDLAKYMMDFRERGIGPRAYVDKRATISQSSPVVPSGRLAPVALFTPKRGGMVERIGKQINRHFFSKLGDGSVGSNQ